MSGEEVFWRIRTRRVFFVRTWLGVQLMHLGLWIMGATAEAADVAITQQ